MGDTLLEEWAEVSLCASLSMTRSSEVVQNGAGVGGVPADSLHEYFRLFKVFQEQIPILPAEVNQGAGGTDHAWFVQCRGRWDGSAATHTWHHLCVGTATSHWLKHHHGLQLFLTYYKASTNVKTLS